MNESLSFVVRPDIESGSVSMNGFVYRDDWQVIGFDPYKIVIGTPTDYKFEVVFHGEPVASLGPEKLKQYFTQRGVKVFDWVKEIFDVMTVIKGASNGFSPEIFAYLHDKRDFSKCQNDAELAGFDAEVLKKIKNDVEIITALNNYHARFGKSGGFINKGVKEFMNQRNYPSLDDLIEQVFIENETEFKEW